MQKKKNGRTEYQQNVNEVKPLWKVYSNTSLHQKNKSSSNTKAITISQETRKTEKHQTWNCHKEKKTEVHIISKWNAIYKGDPKRKKNAVDGKIN